MKSNDNLSVGNKPMADKKTAALSKKPHHLEGDLQIHGNFKGKSRLSKPLITIVTVVRNDKNTLEQTIQSVLGQTFDNLEYIIIDGASTDGTTDIIRKYDNQLAYWVSEPDNGIYDAMNKGIMAASGEWINFMNVGDMFYRPDTIESVFRNYDKTADLIFGHQEVVYHEKLTVVKKARSIKELWKGNLCWHQSLFVRTALMKARPFDLSYKICADFDFALYAYMQNYRFSDSGQIIARILTGGFSDSNQLKGNKEKWRIARRHKNTTKVNLYFAWLHLNTAFKLAVKKIIPRKVTDAIIGYKCR